MSIRVHSSLQAKYPLKCTTAEKPSGAASRPALMHANRIGAQASHARPANTTSGLPATYSEPFLGSSKSEPDNSSHQAPIADPDLNALLDEFEATRAEDPQVAQQLDYLKAEFEWESLSLQAQSAVVQLVGRRADILDSAVPVNETPAAERPTNTPAKPDPVLQTSPKAKLQALRHVLREGLDGYVDMNVVESLRSDMRKLGWDGSDHASLYALLALDPAAESEQSTLMALAWFCASIGAHWKGTNGDPVVEALAAFRDFDELGKKVKTYLRAHFDPELQKEMGIAAGYCPRPHPAVQIGNPQ